MTVIAESDIEAQQSWSRDTFGPGPRTGGLVDHITKELREIEADPTSLEEYIDVVILALDGAWRAGHLPGAILAAYHRKMATNRARVWPDWRQFTQDQAIEHDRTVS